MPEPENSQMFVDEDRLSALRLTLRDLAQFLESQPFLFAVSHTTTCGLRLTGEVTPLCRHSTFARDIKELDKRIERVSCN